VDNQPYDQSAKDAAGYFSRVQEQAGQTLDTSQVSACPILPHPAP
jgi:hypothetical protein